MYTRDPNLALKVQLVAVSAERLFLHTMTHTTPIPETSAWVFRVVRAWEA